MYVGPIGSELAQAFARLGSEVTMFASKILPRENEDARQAVLKAFEEDRIQVITERPISVAQAGRGGGDDGDGGGEITVATSAGDVAFDALLVATGRTPVVPDGLEAAGAVVDPRGGVLVEKTLAVKGCGSKVFAVGDCIAGNFQFTHLAGTQGFTAARNALLPGEWQ
jgi:pyruvate/2-oxoglutarate dehydrogenase complex dihydrolipoamide dehydrogenase (E3) component